MIKLCGFHLSNYHNKVRIALLEKGVPFEEAADVKPSQDEAYLAKSPMGKVPYVELDGTRLCESEVILEYLEEAFPQKPLLPKDPVARAKVRELVTVMELHMELVVRRLYREVFFGGKVSDETKENVRKDLAKGMRAFKALAKFDPFIAGKELTLADCAAAVHLPLVSAATKLAYGRDALEEVPQVKGYLKMLGERPAFARVNADNKAARQALAAAQAKQ
ncbi:MAG: glutathione S-transferase family protein [Betaproteobacteria bacterium]|nr:glutathione S-transferase family protein [Betaproteobacteria bacterium]